MTILLVWCVLNALPGLFSLSMLATGRHAPSLRYYFTEEQIPTLDPKLLLTLDGVATIANLMIVTTCTLAALLVREKKVLPVAIILGIVQTVAYVDDLVFFEGKNVIAIHVSSALLIAGVVMARRQAQKV